MSESKTGWGRREVVAVVTLLLVIFLFHSFTLRKGHNWGDDFAMYVHHAENIAAHKPYAETGYVYNLREAWYGPRTYPPIFPLLLTPVVALRGLDFQAMKEEEVAALTMSLAVVYLLFRRYLRLPYLLALLAILGFNPVLWEIKDSVTSDYPFWFFFLLTVLLAEMAPRTQDWRSGRAILGGIATGISLYLAYGTRSIGLMLLPGLALYELVRVRRITPYAVCGSLTALLLIGGQRLVLRSQEGSYADQFKTGPGVFLSNIHDYSAVVASFWPPSLGRPFSYLVFALVTLLALRGGWIFLRRFGMRPLEAVLIFYMSFILIWPGNQGMRFLLPLLPLYLAYAFVTLQYDGEGWMPAARVPALAALVLVTAVLYAADYRKRNFATIHEANGLQSFNDLCRYIRTNAAPNDVFIFYRARLLSLMTDRPASVYFLDGTPALYDAQWRYVRQIGAKYIVESPLFEPDRKFLEPVLREHADALKPVWHNRDFVVYQVVQQKE